jgi:hypothetical protein
MNTHKFRGVYRRDGQILIMTVLGISVLAGMAFYVYNTGQQVNDRVAMQSAADSAAASGTVQLARGMNVVAMNNIAMAKLLGTVVVLDSVPMATNMTLAEVTAWQACLQAQMPAIQAMIAHLPDPKEQNVLNAALSASPNNPNAGFLLDRLENEINILTPVDQVLNHSEFNMAATTNWSVTAQDGTPGQGTLWQAIVALGQFNNATKASWGMLAQENAVRYGQSDNANLAFLTPILPVMPAYLGAFTDFEPLERGSETVGSNFATATRKGGPGGAIPEMVIQDAQHQGPPYFSPLSVPPYPYRLGPYARLIRWVNYSFTGGSMGAQPSGNASGLPGDGGGFSFGGSWVGATKTGYSTYGPVAWAMNNLRTWASGNLPDCYFNNPDFSKFMSQLTTIKLEYMFGSQTPQRIHYPKFIPNYNDAKNAAVDPNTPPYMTYYFCVVIISSVPEGDPNWLKPGTFCANVPGYTVPEQPNVNILTPFAGWVDMDKVVANPGLDPIRRTWTRLGDFIWKGKTQPPPSPLCPVSPYWQDIGINLKLDGNGKPIPQPLYVVEFRIFGGLDVGPMVNVSNPCNWSSSDVLPQPMLLDTTKGDCADPSAPGVQVGADVGMRRKLFTFLGVARHTATSNFWQQQFQPANPSGNMVTVAQTELFNNTSWDLWTQDWRAQLVPVSQWDDWTAQMAAGAGDASATNGVLQPNDVTTVAEYLKRLNSQMVNAYMQH